MTDPGPDLDAARARVVERDLTADAIRELTPVVRALPLEALGPVKQLLKRFFSEAPWTAAEDDALAEVVGPGTGGGRHELDPGLALVWAWDGGRFRLRVEDQSPAGPARPGGASVADLGATFGGDVVPEATPSPRTIRFAIPSVHAGAARNYDSPAAAAGDERVARIFGEFDEVSNVLVGPDFVAVTILHADRWEAMLEPVLLAVTSGFAGIGAPAAPEPTPPVTRTLRAGSDEQEERAPRRLERAWTELGALRADRPEHLERVLSASRDAEPARRQVATALLVDAPPALAAREWTRLLDDPSRAVRRGVVDAVAGTGRPESRRILERALGDSDAWARWKALRGIADLGVGSSRSAVEALGSDPDFRVRLEAARLLAAEPRS